jgi:hypothetical protein
MCIAVIALICFLAGLIARMMTAQELIKAVSPRFCPRREPTNI